MHDIETVYRFIFIFSILISLRGLMKVISALLQKDPKPLVYSNRELISLGLSFTYIITYLLSK